MILFIYFPLFQYFCLAAGFLGFSVDLWPRASRHDNKILAHWSHCTAAQAEVKTCNNGVGFQRQRLERVAGALWVAFLGIFGRTKLQRARKEKTIIMVSADGLEPSTHALKGHCSAN
jgi:hypothetical protein